MVNNASHTTLSTNYVVQTYEIRIRVEFYPSFLYVCTIRLRLVFGLGVNFWYFVEQEIIIVNCLASI